MFFRRTFTSLLAIACLSTAALADSPPPAPVTATAPSTQAAADLLNGKPLSHEELDKLISETDAIAKTVSELRGLTPKRTIPRGAMSREQITKRLIQRMDEESTAAEMNDEARTLKRLGLLPAGMDYRQEMLDLLTEQIAGFYDPESRELYIADWIAPSVQRVVMAHEIDHALQDQRFDLLKFTKGVKDNGDASIARSALVEGDGVALMMEFMLRDNGQKIDPWANDKMVNMIAGMANVSSGGKEFDKAPLIIKDGLIFPYTAGLKFIVASRRTHPWSDVDGMYRNPPASTEQIIHPEKYRAGEKPVVINAPALPSLKGWKSLYTNVVGELSFGIILRQHGVAKDKADKAAAGWGGDHIQAFAPPGDDGKALDKIVVIDMSAWDAEQDAVEMFDAMSDAVLKLTGATAFDQKTDTMVSVHDAAGAVTTVERKKDKLLVVVGAPKDLSPKIQADAWAKWTAKK